MPLLRLKLPDKNRLLAGHFVYFGCLGLGFMLVEIAVMQQLSLVLGHPAYSVSVTLAGMLIACGIGSLVAGVAARRWRARTRATRVHAGALMASAVAIALYAVVVPYVARGLPRQSRRPRRALSRLARAGKLFYGHAVSAQGAKPRGR